MSLAAQGDDPGTVLAGYVEAFVNGLVQAGVRHACACPGSRSTPLLLALRSHPAVRLWMHLDERSAAFFALGIAKAGREPVAVVSTSGTAALNFAPAVAEARQGRVPLLVLTADRSHELRSVGANQTMDQIGLYGSTVKRFVELALPEGGAHLRRYAGATAARAAALAAATPAGPVHINMPFREPLVPAARAGAEAGALPDLAITHTERRPTPDQTLALLHRLRSERGLIVCGPQGDPDFPAVVAELAAALSMPVLADPLSQARCGPHSLEHVIDGYDAFLRDPTVAGALRPRVVLRFGATPTSRPLLDFLGDASIEQIVVTDEDGWNDPTLSAAAALHTDARSLCEGLLAGAAGGGRGGSPEWVERWRIAAAAGREAIAETLSEERVLSEPQAVTRVAAALPDGAALFAGNSLPVRDIDTFFPCRRAAVRFLGQRGVSGIDGVVSAALGAAAVGEGPLVLLIGDLSLYHDMNGLLAAREREVGATIVLLNNDGGGIFSFLPQATAVDHFEELFGTPHGLDFARVAALYGLAYTRTHDVASFDAALADSLRSPGVQLIEVPSDREANVALHRRLWSAAGARARAALAAKGCL